MKERQRVIELKVRFQPSRVPHEGDGQFGVPLRADLIAPTHTTEQHAVWTPTGLAACRTPAFQLFAEEIGHFCFDLMLCDRLPAPQQMVFSSCLVLRAKSECSTVKVEHKDGADIATWTPRGLAARRTSPRVLQVHWINVAHECWKFAQDVAKRGDE